MATHPSQAIAPSHEPLFAAPEPANDDAANTKVWHPCGPPGPASVAATGEFLHGMWDACNIFNDADADFRQVALQGFKARSRDVHERIAHTLVHGETASSGALFIGRKGRSLGQPLIELNTIRMVPDLFVSPAHPSPEPYNEVLVLRHECATMTAKRFDIKSTAGLMAITRHALERIHERSLLNGGDLHDTIRSQLWDVDYSLAFAWSAGLHLGTGRRDPTAATAVPFCDGLLIVQNRIVALRDGQNPCEWQAFDRSGVFLKPVAVNPSHAIALPPLYGFEMEGFLVPVAATFIAKDMLRHTQRIYLDFFLRHLERCQKQIPDLPRRTMRCFEMHKVDSQAVAEPQFDIPDIGRRLLPEVLYQRTFETALLSIGWTQHGHPRSWR